MNNDTRIGVTITVGEKTYTRSRQAPYNTITLPNLQEGLGDLLLQISEEIKRDFETPNKGENL